MKIWSVEAGRWYEYHKAILLYDSEEKALSCQEELQKDSQYDFVEVYVKEVE